MMGPECRAGRHRMARGWEVPPASEGGRKRMMPVEKSHLWFSASAAPSSMHKHRPHPWLHTHAAPSTGRSLSLKLIQQLREQGAKLASGQGAQGGKEGVGAGVRTFREVTLTEPIRWAAGWGAVDGMGGEGRRLH